MRCLKSGIWKKRGQVQVCEEEALKISGALGKLPASLAVATVAVCLTAFLPRGLQ